jgi:hypothetical protein
MTQHRAFRPIAFATLSLLVMSAAACGHSSPAAPDPVADTNTPAASTTAIVAAVEPPATSTFLLSAGTFTITDRKGAQLSGVYTGETSESTTSSVTTLTLQVTGGTGALKGATGTLEGHGLGAFTGEGAFSLDISGTIATNGGKKSAKFSATLSGASRISCSDGHVIIRQSADGSGGTKDGRLGAMMQHEVGSAGCS